MRGTFDFTVDTKTFEANCRASISKVGNGSRKALMEACEEILQESLMQVPHDTGTLEQSGFWEITGNYKTGWEATIGYGGDYDPINPKTGQAASSYALIVHEDLTAEHPIGKAKYLEDPVRDYALRKFPRTVFKYVQQSLSGTE